MKGQTQPKPAPPRRGEPLSVEDREIVKQLELLESLELLETWDPNEPVPVPELEETYPR